ACEREAQQAHNFPSQSGKQPGPKVGPVGRSVDSGCDIPHWASLGWLRKPTATPAVAGAPPDPVIEPPLPEPLPPDSDGRAASVNCWAGTWTGSNGCPADVTSDRSAALSASGRTAPAEPVADGESV